jgi:Holliday junction resolvase RusA-like endonuclease
MTPLFHAFVPGRPIVKKNTQRVIGFGKAKRVVYSSRYRSWMRVAGAAISEAVKAQALRGVLDQPMRLKIEFRLRDRQAEPDLSNLIEGPQDMLKSCGVIRDDKLIVEIEARKTFGHSDEELVGTTIFLYSV